MSSRLPACAGAAAGFIDSAAACHVLGEIFTSLAAAAPGAGTLWPSAFAACHSRDAEASRVDNRPRMRRLDSACMAGMHILDVGSGLAAAIESLILPCHDIVIP